MSKSDNHPVVKLTTLQWIVISLIAQLHLGQAQTVWVFQGCYTDSREARLLNSALVVMPSSNSWQACAQACSAYAYFGVQYRQECWCGNSLNPAQSFGASGCGQLCTGNTQQTCGGNFRAIVFQKKSSSVQTITTITSTVAPQQLPPATSSSTSTAIITTSSTVAPQQQPAAPTTSTTSTQQPAPSPNAAQIASQTVGQSLTTDQLNALVALTNNERARYGLAPLVLNSNLVYSAQVHAVDMANTCTMTHTGSDGSTAGSRIAQLIKFFWAGENIAAGYITIQSVVDAWNNSPVHHEILTDGRALAVGFGYAVNNNCPMYKTYWSADFAQPQ